MFLSGVRFLLQIQEMSADLVVRGHGVLTSPINDRRKDMWTTVGGSVFVFVTEKFMKYQRTEQVSVPEETVRRHYR